MELQTTENYNKTVKGLDNIKRWEEKNTLIEGGEEKLRQKEMRKPGYQISLLLGCLILGRYSISSNKLLHPIYYYKLK